MSFLTWQLVSIWIIFSVGRWYYLFFLLHASLGIVGTRSQNSTPSNMVFYQERVTVCRRLPIDNELWLEYHMSHSQSLACHTLGWPIQANPTTNPSQPNDKVSKLNAIQHGFLPREGYGMYLGGYLLITNCDLSTTCLTPRVLHVTLSDGQSEQTQRPIQANPTTTHGQPNDPNDMANPTMAFQQRPTGQLLPNQWRPTNQRRPIHQRRPTRQEASGTILRGLPSHHSSALSPLYATPTCPHCSHYWHWHRWRLWSLSSDVRGRKHAQRQQFIIND